MISAILANPIFLNAAAGLGATLITALLGYMTKMLGKTVADEKKANVISDSLVFGVQSVYEEFVRDIKSKAVDGKLTAEDRERATRKAMLLATEFARTKGVELGSILTQEMIRAGIASTVEAIKKGTLRITGASK